MADERSGGGAGGGCTGHGGRRVGGGRAGSTGWSAVGGAVGDATHTWFIRDPDAWTYLGRDLPPRVLQAKASAEPIRCWCAGAASGEEAYSLAIMLTEALGVDQFRRRVKIYATDVDEEALSQARLGG